VKWRRLQIEELCNLYSPNIIRWSNKKDEMSGVCGTYGGQERYRVFVRKPDGKVLLGRPKRRWDDNIKIVLKMCDEEVWTRMLGPKIGTGGGHL